MVTSKPPKGRAIISIPKEVDMWSSGVEAERRRKKAHDLVKKFSKLAREERIPEGWTVEIHG